MGSPATSLRIMTPTTSTPAATPFNCNDQPTIALPPPASGGGHSRSRSSVQLPPLSARPPSLSPTRYSTFLPSLRSSRSSSPERGTREGSEADFEGVDAKHQIDKRKSTASIAKLSTWFEGASDPVHISLVPSPRKETSASSTATDHDNSTMFPPHLDGADNLTRRPSSRYQTPPNQAGRSRFNFFRKTAQPQAGLSAEDSDELSRLDIQEALFPQGQPDEVSAEAFKSLQLHAESTLQRFQVAHIEQEKMLKSVTAANKTQADDLEAAETRNQHLKLQLGEMAERAAEQERQIAALKTELDAVRQQQQHQQHQQPACEVPLSQGGIRKVSQSSDGWHRHKRQSGVSVSGSESGSDNISVFSDPMSACDSPGTSVAASPVVKHAVLHRMDQPQAVMPLPECQKCHGLGRHEAWDVVSMMKIENGALKHRIAELEGAHDDALGFLKSLNIV